MEQEEEEKAHKQPPVTITATYLQQKELFPLTQVLSVCGFGAEGIRFDPC